jgi:hypothetical protein
MFTVDINIDKVENDSGVKPGSNHLEVDDAAREVVEQRKANRVTKGYRNGMF